MAKNTAKAKGYRKTPEKKPYLTKKEIITTLAIVGAVILAVALFMLLHDDGFISSKQIKDGDIVAYASKTNKNRFLKLAEVNEMKGYTMTDSPTASGMSTYSFHPDDESDPLDSFFLSTSNQEAAGLADTVTAQIADMLSDNDSTVIHDIAKTSVQGYDAYLIAYSYDYYEPAIENETADPAAEPVSNTYLQNLTLYVRYDDAHTLILHAYLTGEDGSFHIPEAEMLDYVLDLTASFTMVEKA